jgi:tetratricopeptide (TPR) repeat protein
MTARRRLLVFISFAGKDRDSLDELIPFLAQLEQEGLAEIWYDDKLHPGDRWHEEIDRRLQAASVVVLLCSTDYLASDNCRWEMKQAQALHLAGRTRLVPVYLRELIWEAAPLAGLSYTPRGRRPIAAYQRHDEAWLEVVREVRRVLLDLQPTAPRLDRPPAGNPSPALNDAARLHSRGLELLERGQLRSAQELFERAIVLLANDPAASAGAVATCRSHLAETLRRRGDLDEALEQAVMSVEYPRQPGADTRDRIARLSTLASIHAERREPRSARRCLAEAQEMAQRYDVRDAPEVAAALLLMAHLNLADGELAEAQRCCELAVRIDESRYGPVHPETALDYNTLGLVLKARRRHRAARHQFQQAHTILAAVLPAEHPYVIAVGRNLAHA